MLGAIAGDVVGSRFEGNLNPPADFELMHENCRFTDDTVCSLAVAHAIMTGEDFAETMRAFVLRHPFAGYGGMFLSWAAIDGAPAYGSWGNGAPMRVASVGWLAKDQAECDDLAAKQANISHNHPSAIKGAQAIARAILLLRQGEPKGRVATHIADVFGYDLCAEIALRPRGFDVSAAGTVPAALAAAFESETWEEAVRCAVGVGGDTDTLACMAGAVAEAIYGVPPEIAAQVKELLTPDLHAVLTRFESEID